MLQSASTVRCAWCGTHIDEFAGISGPFGLCRKCLGEGFHTALGNISAVNDRFSDLLPFGFIRLDVNGIVLQYNTAESALSGLPPERVKGRNFFRSVAPCTCVDEFEGLTKRMVAVGLPARERIQFLFKLPGRSIMADIVVMYDPERKVITLLVRKAHSSSPDMHHRS